MDTTLRDRFTELWRRYFNQAELPLAFEFTADARGAEPAPPFVRHRCVIGQLIQARNGRTLCLTPDSMSCRGEARYLHFRDSMFPNFNEFISHNTQGEGERYRRTPEQVQEYISTLPVLPIRGRNLLIKRWDKLDEADSPDAVIFFAAPDVLSGLFTLTYYDSDRPDAVTAPFGSGCFSTFYQVYREQVEGTQRAVLGMFDPSARKCVKSNMLTFSIPYGKFERMIGQMDESFLATHSWEIVQRRI